MRFSLGYTVPRLVVALPGIPFELIPLRIAHVTAIWPSARSGILQYARYRGGTAGLSLFSVLQYARYRCGTAGLSVISVSKFASQVFRRNSAYVLDAALPDLSI